MLYRGHFFCAVWGVITVSLVLSSSVAHGQRSDPARESRYRMVTEFIEREGITNTRVLDSIRQVPRHEFVTPQHRRESYTDSALPIGFKQTISPPFVVAYMTQTIDPQPEDRVLEIGTGSGYQAAVLSKSGPTVVATRDSSSRARPTSGSVSRARAESPDSTLRLHQFRLADF